MEPVAEITSLNLPELTTETAIRAMRPHKIMHCNSRNEKKTRLDWRLKMVFFLLIYGAKNALFATKHFISKSDDILIYLPYNKGRREISLHVCDMKC